MRKIIFLTILLTTLSLASEVKAEHINLFQFKNIVEDKYKVTEQKTIEEVEFDEAVNEDC